jgi:hypothetical protein
MLIVLLSPLARATPSTQIWIPSTDYQKFGSFHFGIDNYIRMKNYEGIRGAGMYDVGLTAGLLPFNKIKAEAGIDYVSMGDHLYDMNPMYFHLKVGLPEDSLFKYCPGIAFGAFNFGTKVNLTNYNVGYGLLSKNIPILGRLSVGYYMGNKKVLLDDKGNVSNGGVLVSWDRTITEISDKLWLAVDYQGGQNYMGALSVAFAWSFSSNVSVLFGYNHWNNQKVTYNTTDKNVDSFTTQLDINF